MTQNTETQNRLIDILFNRESFMAHLESTPVDVQQIVMPIVSTGRFLELLRERVGPAILELLTEEEVNAIVEFYSTPIGASLLKKLPGISGTISTVTMEVIQQMSSEIVKDDEVTLIH